MAISSNYFPNGFDVLSAITFANTLDHAITRLNDGRVVWVSNPNNPSLTKDILVWDPATAKLTVQGTDNETVTFVIPRFTVAQLPPAGTKGRICFTTDDSTFRIDNGTSWAAFFPNPMTTLGDLIYGGANGTPTRLPGNTSTTKAFLQQTGNGVNSAAPVWAPVPIAIADGGTGATTVSGIRSAIGIDPTAKGDLFPGGGASSVVRLPAGADGQALVARSTATPGLAYVQVGAPQTFQGLQLRTHPDETGNGAGTTTKIMLVHADQIVMNDGEVTTGWDQLVADSSVTGAGGLDTGSVVGNTWYETYAIRKKSDGTKALLLHRRKNYVLDQAQMSGTATTALRDATARTKLAQSFKVVTTGKVEVVDVPLQRIGTPSGRIWFTIEADNSGAPSGIPLATSDKATIDALQTAAPPDFNFRAVFRTPTTVTAGVTYWLVLQGDYAIGANNILWYRDTANSYPNGSPASFDGTTWTNTTNDMAFKIYTTQNDTAVTMPSGYDQFCLLGFFYTNPSSPFRFDGMAYTDRTASWLVRSTGGGGTGFEGFTVTTPVIRDSTILFPHGLRVLIDVAGFCSVAASVTVAGVPEGYMKSASNFDGGTTAFVAAANTSAYAGRIVSEYGGLYVFTSTGTATVFTPTWTW
jgi:hypothetical protein